MRVYRVVVRGPFQNLTVQTKSWLVASADEHDIFLSSFTPEGTFTYDKRLAAFNLRYEVRVADGSTDDDPSAIALAEANMFLRTMGIGHGALRASVMDMNAMTERTQRTQLTKQAKRTNVR